MILQKPHQLICHTLRWSELSLIDAIFLHRADGLSSFPHAPLNSRGEERFTSVLHVALHRSLHRSAVGKARQVNPIDVPKAIGLREGWNDVRALRVEDCAVADAAQEFVRQHV
jgi:hypothetical protein